MKFRETVIKCFLIGVKMVEKGIFNIVFIQMNGTKTSQGTGGGLFSQELLAKLLIARGVKVYTITNPRDTYGFQFLGDKRFVAEFIIPSSSAFNWFVFNRKRLKDELSSIVMRLPEDSLYVTVDPFPSDIYAAKVLKKLGKKVIITMYHITPSPLFHPVKRGVLRSVMAWLISLNALSFVKMNNIPIFLDNKRIASELGWRFNNNLMEMPLSLPEYKRNSISETRVGVCFVGRLAKNKGIADLIQSWRTIVKKVPGAYLYIIGKDWGNGVYQKMINKYRLQESIMITGFLDDEEKKRIMNKCSIFAFPSYEEGWALAVMEAIDTGLLPVIYNLPAYDYICNKEIKIKVGDVKKFADTVTYFLLHYEERSTIVKDVQGCIGKFTPAYMAQVWINQIQEYYASL